MIHLLMTNTSDIVEFYTFNLQYLEEIDSYFISEQQLYIPKKLCSVVDVDEYPDDIEPTKYCYTTEKGFYLNPDWKEPTVDLTDEQRDAVVQEIQDAVAGKE